MTTLRGKIALVTGASAGIGQSTAMLLARRGARVFAAARRSDKIAGLADSARARGWQIEAIQLDVTDQASIELAAEHIRQATAGHGLDILVNNAGYGQIGPLEEIPLAALRRQFETNVISIVALVQQFAPAMRERRSGTIINVGSVGGRIGLPFLGAYIASKHAVEGLSDALRVELARWNINVVVIEPGAAATEFSAAAYASMQRPAASAYGHAGFLLDSLEHAGGIGAPPEQVARAIVRAAASSRPPTRAIVPAYYGLAVLLYKLLPTRLIDGAMQLGLRAIEKKSGGR